MDIPAFFVTASTKTTVNPADPFAVGSYTIGNSQSRVVFDTVDQLFTIDATDMTGTATLDCSTGILTGSTGGTIIGGFGRDPDGVTVAFAQIMSLHVRNTGLTAIQLENSSYTGTDEKIVEFVQINPGGEFLASAPSGAAFTLQTIEILETASAAACSFELMAVGSTT